MKKQTYIYKLKKRYQKNPEVLLNYGFQYFEDEEGKEKIFAHNLKISPDNPLFKQCILFLEHVYNGATTEERERDFCDFEFRLELQEDQSNKWKLVMNDDLAKEFAICELCVSVNRKDRDFGILFINSPLQDAHFNYKTLQECAPELINNLLNDKIISARIKYY